MNLLQEVQKGWFCIFSVTQIACFFTMTFVEYELSLSCTFGQSNLNFGPIGVLLLINMTRFSYTLCIGTVLNLQPKNRKPCYPLIGITFSGFLHGRPSDSGIQ